jgi:hypothetical protein
MNLEKLRNQLTKELFDAVVVHERNKDMPKIEWREAALLRAHLQRAVCAALEIEQQATGHKPPKHGD